jgi:DNA-binding GntR family transcriptional regulator
MRLQGVMKRPGDPNMNREDWPIADSLLASEGAYAPLTQTIAADMSTEMDTLAARTYAQLRHALIVGRIAPGESFTLRALARRLGTSVTPVRDALSRLAAADALCLRRQSGFVVPTLSRSELDEILQLRLAVENFAFARAAPQYRVTDRRGFKVRHAELCRVAELDDAAQFSAAVWSLRVAILGLARPSVLTMLADRIWCRIGPTFTQAAADIEQRRRISCLLGRIVTAIASRDLAGAHKALVDEITAATLPCRCALVDEPSAPPLVPTSLAGPLKASSHCKSGADHE